MVKAVVGANWGDEGKGKITDMLGKESDIIVRFQGGANAGHTIVNDYGKFALHTLPSEYFTDIRQVLSEMASHLMYPSCSMRFSQLLTAVCRSRRSLSPTEHRW